MRETGQNFQNQGSYPQNFLENDDELLQNMIQNADVTLAEQPVLDFPENLFNFQEFHTDQYLYNSNNSNVMSNEIRPNSANSGLDTPIYPEIRPNSANSGLDTPIYYPVYEMTNEIKCESETRSPLSYSEENVNLCELKNEQNLSCPISNPLLILSIIPWPGPYNFRVNIPPPNLQGVKPKWCFSSLLNKLYVARNVAFPVNITLDNYIEGAILNICPVFTKSSNRMVPVQRCPNCQMADRNPEASHHIIQVEGSSPYYFEQNERCMLSIPLGHPAPGDNSLSVFLRVCCNTSCVGGPNRKPFSILITLRHWERDIGRQVIDVKCCEGPLRDMATDEKRENKSKLSETNGDLNTILQVANDVATIKVKKSAKKRKMTHQIVDQKDDSEEYEVLKIPKKFSRDVKKYVNTLYMRDQLKKKNQDIPKFFSTTSESDQNA